MAVVGSISTSVKERAVWCLSSMFEPDIFLTDTTRKTDLIWLGHKMDNL